MVNKENKIQTKRILELVNEGLILSKIALILKKSKATISEKLKSLERQELIKSISNYPKIYELTKNGQSSLCVRDTKSQRIKNTKSPFFKATTNIHNLKIKYAVLTHGKIRSRKIRVNNWIKQIISLKGTPNITLEITTKSVIAHINEINLPRNSGFTNNLNKLSHSITARISLYLKQYGYSIDNTNPEIISQHMATQTDNKIDKQVPKGSTTEIKLGRKARSVYGKMANEARAWGDKSDSIWEIETDDLTYEEKMILMPEIIHQMKSTIKSQNRIQKDYEHNLKRYTKQIELHLKVEKEQLKTQKMMQKMLEKLGKRLV